MPSRAYVTPGADVRESATEIPAGFTARSLIFLGAGAPVRTPGERARVRARVRELALTGE